MAGDIQNKGQLPRGAELFISTNPADTSDVLPHLLDPAGQQLNDPLDYLKVPNVLSCNPGGTAAADIDVTNWGSSIRQSVNGLKAPSEGSFIAQYQPEEDGHRHLYTLLDSGDVHHFYIRLMKWISDPSNIRVDYFRARIKNVELPTEDPDTIRTLTVTIVPQTRYYPDAANPLHPAPAYP